MSKNFLFVLTVSMLLAAGFSSCNHPSDEPVIDETADVPSAATVDSLWDAEVMFDDTTQFELLHANLKWESWSYGSNGDVNFEIVFSGALIEEPTGSGNMYKFCPFDYMDFVIVPHSNSLSNLQGFYSTFTKSKEGTLYTGEQEHASLFTNINFISGNSSQVYYNPLEAGKLALIKINDIQYYVRFQVAVEYKDETHYYCLSDTLFGRF